MKIKQSTIQRTFVVEHNGKRYNIDYLNSDGQILGLINRNNWEIYDEDLEELKINSFQAETKKEIEQVKKNRRLFAKLIKFCINHFEDYNPALP